MSVILFDMDGTLLDTEEWYQIGWGQAFADCGYEMTREQVLGMRSLGKPFAREYVAGILGENVDLEAIRARRNEIMEPWLLNREIPLKPDVERTLKALREAGHITAVVTATRPPRAQYLLEKTGLLPWFDKIVSTSMVEKGKPAPDVYLYACKELGIAPEDAYAVEDSPNGVSSAYAAGCKVIMVPDLTEPDQELQKKIWRKASTMFEIIDELTEDRLQLPEAFEEKMKDLLGSEYDEFLTGYKNQKHQALRFNPLKKGFEDEREVQYLGTLGVQEQIAVSWAKHAYYYVESEEVRPGKHPLHELGLYYIQEPSAMSAAALLAPEPGDVVLDLCAAPGGKTTQLAGMMNQEGLLIANEIIPSRAKILAQNVERLGIGNAIVTNEDGAALARKFPSYFNKIMVDAPCSGEGMFRKNPQAVSEWDPEHVAMCSERQTEVIDYAASMLAPGGKMVYSTCTFSPEENEQVIARFLQDHPDFNVEAVDAPWFDAAQPEWADGNQELAHTFRLWPHKIAGEGHYAAVLRRCGTDLERKSTEKSGKKSKRNEKSALDKERMKLLQEFTSSVLSKEMEAYILSGKLILFGDQLYRLPAFAPELRGLKVLRAGLAIGSFKKNRFEPDHALALFLGAKDVKNSLNLASTDRDAIGYLKGETVCQEAKKGWCLICIDGFSAGWGKSGGNQVKNHYPKGLRKA